MMRSCAAPHRAVPVLLLLATLLWQPCAAAEDAAMPLENAVVPESTVAYQGWQGATK